MIHPSFTQTSSVSMRILNHDQIEEIIGAAFEIVETVGCRMTDEKARAMFQQHGVVIGGDRVKIPRHLVQQALETAPRGFTIYNRLGERAMNLEGRKTYFGTSTGSPNTLDPLTGTIRPTTLQDIAHGALIADALTNIDFVMPMGSAGDVLPPLAQEVHEFETIVKNTVKPVVMLSYSRRAFRKVYEMAAAIAGGFEALRQKPFLLAYPEPITPLVFPKSGTERMMMMAEWGLPQRDLIAKVGPGGNYLQENHTAAEFKKEIWMPGLMTREAYTTWQDGGRKSSRDRIVDRIKTILQTHHPEPLKTSVLEKVEAFRRTADQELA